MSLITDTTQLRLISKLSALDTLTSGDLFVIQRGLKSYKLDVDDFTLSATQIDYNASTVQAALSALELNSQTPDGVTLEVSGGLWQVADGGIADTQLAVGAVGANKIGSGAVDNVTIQLNGSGQLTVTNLTSDATKTTISKFAGDPNSSRSFYDGMAFVDGDGYPRVIGNSNSNRFGNINNCYAPALLLNLPNTESASEIYLTKENVFVLTTSGKIYGIGNNAFGNVGDGSGTGGDISSLSQTDTGSEVFTKVAMSYQNDEGSFAALTNDGKVYTWGINQFGQLGDGTTTNRSTPVQTLGPGNSYGNPTTEVADIFKLGSLNGFLQYSEAFLARMTDGTVYAVGYGITGFMGDGNTNATNSSWIQVLTGVATPLTGVSEIRVSGHDAVMNGFALLSSGELYGWGYNGQGELGLGNTTQQNFAQLMTSGDLVDDFWTCSNSSGGSTFIKKNSDSRIYATGENSGGQLGLGDTTDRTSFTNVSTLNSIVVDVIYTQQSNSGSIWVIAKEENSNTIYGTGTNSNGQLGLGDRTNRTSFIEIVHPIPITEEITDILPSFTPSIGGWTSILTDKGEYYAAGYNRFNIISTQGGENRAFFAKATSLVTGG